MVKVQELIDSAAKLSGLIADGQMLESNVNSDALNSLNIMLAQWEGR